MENKGLAKDSTINSYLAKDKNQVENKVLAVVSGIEITQNDLEEVIMRYPEDKRRYFNNEQGKKQLLEQIIAFELFNKFGLENNLDETEEYKKEIEKVKKDILTQMTINKVLSDIVITDEDMKKYYEQNKAQFKKPETISAKHILVSDIEEANSIKEELNNNSISFEEAAKKYSTCPSKEQGGDLGEFGRGMMVPEFEKAAFELEIGEISEAVKTQFGYHIILVESKNEAKEEEFDKVKDMIFNQMTQQAQQKKYIDMIMQLESKYGVERK